MVNGALLGYIRGEGMLKSSNGIAYHVAVFGALNAGKSSLINKFLAGNNTRTNGRKTLATGGSEAAEVSDLPGTTKQVSLYEVDVQPMGRTVFIDTPGYHHGGKLGVRWLDAADEVMERAHVALLVVDIQSGGITSVEKQLIQTLHQRDIPVITVVNKCDRVDSSGRLTMLPEISGPHAVVSSLNGEGLDDVRELLKTYRPDVGPELIVGDLVESGDTVVIVVPAAAKAPKGNLEGLHARLFRELLDAGAMPMAVSESQLPQAITGLTRAPSLIIAESNHLERMLLLLPPDIPVTTFALLMARRQGNLGEFLQAARSLPTLSPGDRILIAEGCVHRPLHEEQVQRDLPDMLRTLVGGPLQIEYASGCALPSEMSKYKLVIHCDACRLSRREVLHRQALGRKAGVPVVSIGILQSYVVHALPRVLEPMKENGVIQGNIEDLEPVQERRGPRMRTESSGRVRRTVTLAV